VLEVDRERDAHPGTEVNHRSVEHRRFLVVAALGSLLGLVPAGLMLVGPDQSLLAEGGPLGSF